jgi:hypothetical protein
VRPHTDSLIVVNGSLIATPNHAFRTTHGWARAESLEVGDVLLRAGTVDRTGGEPLDVAPAAVEGLEVRPGSVTTYNLEVAVHHSYFAGGLLVEDGP